MHKRPMTFAKDVYSHPPKKHQIISPIGSLRQKRNDKKSPQGKHRLTHWNTQQADAHLHAGNDEKDLEDTGLQEPLVGTPRQPKAEKILEDEHASKRFDRDLS